MKFVLPLIAGLTVASLGGCASWISPDASSEWSSTAYRPYQKLLDLPSPASRITVAVYRYDDKTGQFKPSEAVQTLSRAVTQGAASILVQALQNAGRGTWFEVLEREGLQNILTERQIITEMRKQYLSPEGKKMPPIGPMRYAGVIFEGGVIGFDSNTLTGGLGARYLAIGGNVEYREDTVSVYLRAISTQNGAILKSVMATKKILSFLVRGGVFKFIDFRDLLEIEAGYTSNEPGLFALKKAVETAVYLMVMEGAENNLWSFRDPEKGREALEAFRKEERKEVKTAASNPQNDPTTKTDLKYSEQSSRETKPRNATTTSETMRTLEEKEKATSSAASPTEPQSEAAAKTQSLKTSRKIGGRPKQRSIAEAAEPIPWKPVALGVFGVHIASSKSANAARAAWTRLRQAHPDLFSRVKATVVEEDLGPDRGKEYRLLAGPFGDATAAEQFCDSVKKRGLYCASSQPPLIGREYSAEKPATGRPPLKSGTKQPNRSKQMVPKTSQATAAPTLNTRDETPLSPATDSSGRTLRNWTAQRPAGFMSVNSSPYLVQLASMKSESGVLTAWSRLSRAHPDLFEGIRPAMERKNLGPEKGIFFRLLVGPFFEADAADDFCSRAKERNLSCLVWRR